MRWKLKGFHIKDRGDFGNISSKRTRGVVKDLALSLLWHAFWYLAQGPLHAGSTSGGAGGGGERVERELAPGPSWNCKGGSLMKVYLKMEKSSSALLSFQPQRIYLRSFQRYFQHFECLMLYYKSGILWLNCGWSFIKGTNIWQVCS